MAPPPTCSRRGHGPQGRDPSLEKATKLVRPLARLESGRWVFTLVPDAAEGGGCFVSARKRVRREELPRSKVSAERPEGFVAPVWDDDGSEGVECDESGGPDRERAAEEAARRARGKVRRYGVANRLTRLGTLTYGGEGCFDFDAHRRNLGLFFRRLRAGTGGKPFPYLAVPEWHPGGHGLHAHFLVGRYIARGVIEGAWPHGFVHIKLIGGLGVGSGPVGEARVAARYVAGYATKGSAAPRGRNRYYRARGFSPRVERLEGRTADDVLGWAATIMGGPPEWVWRSRDDPDWVLPASAVWASWPG
jgi:hypothetical protein